MQHLILTNELYNVKIFAEVNMKLSKKIIPCIMVLSTAVTMAACVNQKSQTDGMVCFKSLTEDGYVGIVENGKVVLHKGNLNELFIMDEDNQLNELKRCEVILDCDLHKNYDENKVVNYGHVLPTNVDKCEKCFEN